MMQCWVRAKNRHSQKTGGEGRGEEPSVREVLFEQGPNGGDRARDLRMQWARERVAYDRVVVLHLPTSHHERPAYRHQEKSKDKAGQDPLGQLLSTVWVPDHVRPRWAARLQFSTRSWVRIRLDPRSSCSRAEARFRTGVRGPREARGSRLFRGDVATLRGSFGPSHAVLVVAGVCSMLRRLVKRRRIGRSC